MSKIQLDIGIKEVVVCMGASEAFKKELIERIPDLKRFARVLTKNTQDSEDLMQDTIMSALAKADDYQPGTNMVAWLFTIQRSLFNNSRRKKDRTQKVMKTVLDASPRAALPDQLDRLELEDMFEVIESLPVDQKSALYLVAHDGYSYAEAAEVLSLNVGTVKSRVSRARAEIAKSLDMVQTERGGRVSAPKGI